MSDLTEADFSCKDQKDCEFIGCIIDGCPPLIQLRERDIQSELDKRKPGQSKFVTQRKEQDIVQIISGVFEGKTTGTPIGLIIQNQDQKSKDYENIKDKFRPGHADYTYQQKYGIRDYRGGGRASARETAMRVAGGAVAKKILSMLDVDISAGVVQIGHIAAEKVSTLEAANNEFNFVDSKKMPDLEAFFNQLHHVLPVGVVAGLALHYALEAVVECAVVGIEIWRLCRLRLHLYSDSIFYGSVKIVAARLLQIGRAHV